MKHYPSLLLLILLSGCLAGNNPSLQQMKEDARIRYNEQFAGQSSDSIVTHYGAPSRTVKLDGGLKVLEYTSKRTYLWPKRKRETETCTLRFWIGDKKVIKVDDIGERTVCLHFIDTKERSEVLDNTNY